MNTLSDRMKRYERQTNTELPRRTYTLMRLDGRAFHTHTRRFKRPFDEEFATAMNRTAQSLCAEIQGVEFAYVQSDEISLLLTDFKEHGTEPWFAGEVQKMVSLSAAWATMSYNLVNTNAGGNATFDSRVWTIADPNEVANYFIWRQRDAIKNSITMAAQAVASHKELEGLNSDERQELMFQRGVNWNNYPTGFKRGRVIVRESYAGPEGSIRHRWSIEPAPKFQIQPGGWFERIPPMPVFP